MADQRALESLPLRLLTTLGMRSHNSTDTTGKDVSSKYVRTDLPDHPVGVSQLGVVLEAACVEALVAGVVTVVAAASEVGMVDVEVTEVGTEGLLVVATTIWPLQPPVVRRQTPSPTSLPLEESRAS